MRSTFTTAIRVCIASILFITAFTTSTFGQHHTGSIHGIVLDGDTREYIPGAKIYLLETKQYTLSNDTGYYVIKNIPHGHYKVIFESFGFDSDTIPVHVKSNHNTELNHTMGFSVTTTDAIHIHIEQKTNTEEAVVTEIKDKTEVVSGISGEQIKKSQDRDAAQAMSRIPGVTIIGGRFVIIRGLSERYNNVMINDAISPSTEAERRSFSFDLIPSSMLDRMLVFKSGGAEHPGDFAGGVIKVYTTKVRRLNSFDYNFSLSYRPGSTFEPFYKSKGSSTDFLGFDNGYRALPDDFPAYLLTGKVSKSDIENATKSLPNNFNTKEITAIPDLRFGVNLSRRFDIGDVEAGTVTGISYTQTYQSFEANRWRYDEYEPSLGRSLKEFEYKDNVNVRNVRVGVMSNWSFFFNKRNEIEFKNMFNQLGEEETIVREGIEYSRPGDIWKNYSYRYTSRSIYSGQLSGEHQFKNDKTSFHWVTGLSYVHNNTPDWRRLRSVKPASSDDPYQVVIPPSAATFDVARFYSKLNEMTVMNSADLTHKILRGGDSAKIVTIKTGYYVERKSRSFDARWMAYKSKNGNFANEASYLPLDQIFIPENINVDTAFFLEEGTNPFDKYEAQNLLTSGFMNASSNFGKVGITAGMRGELNKQTLQSKTNQGPVDIDNPIFRVLPFANVSYNFSKQMLIRAAYSKTINRPEFREIAPLFFYDFELNANVEGNPDLKVADIHNADVRWELYPSEGETVSFGVFYKRFINPIESYIRQGTSQPIFTFGNANYAQNYGIEVEARKSLLKLSEIKFVQNLGLVCNVSLIKSRVDLGSQAKGQDTLRALQGQSPYVVNAGAVYNDEERGIMVNILYNVYGPRIFAVGDNLNPTVYELPRHLIDLTLTKKLSDNFDFRFGVQDLLNFKARMYQDTDRNGKITGIDEPILTFRRGGYFTMGITGKF